MKYSLSNQITGLRLRALTPQTLYRELATDAYPSTGTLPVNANVTLTGAYITISGVEYYQLADAPDTYITLGADNYGWTDTGHEAPHTAAQAQKLVNQIIDANKTILENNLFAARFAHHLTPAQKQQVVDLQRRLERRNKEITDGIYCTNITTSSPKGYQNYANHLRTLIDRAPYIGIATWVIIAVVATVIISLGSAAYFAYRAYASEAINDVKYSRELTRTLQAKLTPQEWEQLRHETAGLISKNTILQKLNSFGSTISRTLLIAGGALLILNLDTIKQTFQPKPKK